VDIRKQPLSNKQIEGWLQQVDWEQLLNRRSTSWRQLSADERNSVDKTNVGALLLQHPTLIKRPVLSHQQQLLIGFNESIYQQQLGKL